MTESIAHYVRIAPDEPLPDISALAPFKAVVVIEADYTPEWQETVSRWLVESGCRYMMAWGPNCSSWDNSVDHADIAAGGLEDDTKFVLTTWHDDESLESVFWFSRFCAEYSYADVALPNAVILHLSEKDRRSELLELFVRSETLADREDDER